MARVVLTKKNAPAKKKVAKPAAKSVASKRVRDSHGHVRVLHELDFGSDTFGRDFQYVFSRNVKKARRENKRIVGSADVDVAKR
jgi:hypothetical protein